METKNIEKLVISLIRNDLINYKLVSTLNELGINATDYYLSLSEEIFTLMGFQGDDYSDEVYEIYLGMLKKARRFNFPKSTKSLEKRAFEIYLMLQGTSSKSEEIAAIIEEPPVQRNEQKAQTAA